ncbi:MAG TPA: SAM-dependent methyltransferase [Pilimelia sp.]|nr:SAM-dependent methyltransferase [Pilimelia sp.]
MPPQPPAPSTARMIDYWLGGAHHFPVDVAAARAFEEAYGPCAHIFRSLRAFLGRAVRLLRAHGVRRYLVFGAGIPTCGNVHEVVPDAHVLYVDIDPENVALGRQILAGHPRATYAEGDVTDLGTIPDEVRRAALPGWDEEPVGVVFLGLAAFLDDPTLARTLADLHAAVPPGSWLAIDVDTLELAEHPRALEMMGPGFHMRDPATVPALLGPWRLTEDGLQPVARWRAGPPPEPVPDAFYGGVAVARHPAAGHG